MLLNKQYVGIFIIFGTHVRKASILFYVSIYSGSPSVITLTPILPRVHTCILLTVNCKMISWAHTNMMYTLNHNKVNKQTSCKIDCTCLMHITGCGHAWLHLSNHRNGSSFFKGLQWFTHVSLQGECERLRVSSYLRGVNSVV